MQLKKTCMALLTFATWICHPVQAREQDAMPNDIVRSTDDKSPDQLSETVSSDVLSKRQLSAEEAKHFIETTGNEIIKILANKQTRLSVRKKSFNGLLVKKFNIKAIGKFVLGRYWRQLDQKQTAEYLDLFQSSLVDTYAAQFNKYSNQQLNVISSSVTEKGSTLVKSEVIQPRGGEPIKVDWQIFKKPKTGIRIYDIIINGVSMSITKRNEYASLIQSTGEGVNGLLRYMRSDHLRYMRSDYNVVDPVQVKAQAKIPGSDESGVSDDNRMIDTN